MAGKGRTVEVERQKLSLKKQKPPTKKVTPVRGPQIVRTNGTETKLVTRLPRLGGQKGTDLYNETRGLLDNKRELMPLKLTGRVRHSTPQQDRHIERLKQPMATDRTREANSPIDTDRMASKRSARMKKQISMKSPPTSPLTTRTRRNKKVTLLGVAETLSEAALSQSTKEGSVRHNGRRELEKARYRPWTSQASPVLATIETMMSDPQLRHADKLLGKRGTRSPQAVTLMRQDSAELYQKFQSMKEGAAEMELVANFEVTVAEKIAQADRQAHIEAERAMLAEERARNKHREQMLAWATGKNEKGDKASPHRQKNARSRRKKMVSPIISAFSKQSARDREASLDFIPEKYKENFKKSEKKMRRVQSMGSQGKVQVDWLKNGSWWRDAYLLNRFQDEKGNEYFKVLTDDGKRGTFAVEFLREPVLESEQVQPLSLYDSVLINHGGKLVAGFVFDIHADETLFAVISDDGSRRLYERTAMRRQSLCSKLLENYCRVAVDTSFKDENSWSEKKGRTNPHHGSSHSKNSSTDWHLGILLKVPDEGSEESYEVFFDDYTSDVVPGLYIRRMESQLLNFTIGDKVSVKKPRHMAEKKCGMMQKTGFVYRQVAKGKFDILFDAETPLGEGKRQIIEIQYIRKLNHAITVEDLFLCCKNDLLEVVEKYVESGQDINFQDNEGKTVLHHCCIAGHERTVSYLVIKGGIDTTLVDNSHHKAFDYAFLLGRLNVMTFVVRYNASKELGKVEDMVPRRSVSNALVSSLITKFSQMEDGGGFGLKNVNLMRTEDFMNEERFLSYKECVQKGLLKKASSIHHIEDPKILFISHRWEKPDEPDPMYDQFRLCKEFITNHDEDIDFVWLDYSSIIQSKDSPLFRVHLKNIPLAILLSTHFLVVPRYTRVTNINDLRTNGISCMPLVNLPVTDLRDYLNRGWCRMEALACMMTGARFFCCYEMASLPSTIFGGGNTSEKTTLSRRTFIEVPFTGVDHSDREDLLVRRDSAEVRKPKCFKGFEISGVLALEKILVEQYLESDAALHKKKQQLTVPKILKDHQVSSIKRMLWKGVLSNYWGVDLSREPSESLHHFVKFLTLELKDDQFLKGKVLSMTLNAEDIKENRTLDDLAKKLGNLSSNLDRPLILKTLLFILMFFMDHIPEVDDLFKVTAPFAQKKRSKSIPNS